MKHVPHNQIAHYILSTLGVEIKEYTILDERHGSIIVSEESLEGVDLSQVIQYLNTLIAKISEKQGDIPLFFDINNYKKKREELIIQLTQQAAETVSSTKESVDLPPMNSYERRVVHQEIGENNPNLQTESSGKGRERHVRIYLKA